MKQMVEIYIKLAELETKKEVGSLFKQEHDFFFFVFSMLTYSFHLTYCQDTNKKIPLPREARSIGQLELVR
jgi:ataxia telangiectasia mutated family protein